MMLVREYWQPKVQISLITYRAMLQMPMMREEFPNLRDKLSG